MRALYEQEGSGGLHERLAARDSEAACRLEPGDSQRVMRAYEVVEATGRSLLSWQAEKHEAACLKARGRASATGPQRSLLVPPRGRSFTTPATSASRA